jgi:NHL repeat
MRATHKPSHHRKTLGSIAACCCLAGMLFSAAPALALEGYEPATPASFGEPGPGAGQLEGPEGVAVNDTTGDVYVADVGNARIDEFEADGKFVRAWGWGVTTGAAAFQICTTTCQKGLTGSEPGEFTTGAFIAVDNTTGLSKGDVYVGDPGDNIVTKFTATGALVEPWGTKGQLKEAVAGTPFVEASGVAVDTSGNLWVTDEEHEDEFTEAGVFNPATAFNTGRLGGGVAVDANDALYTVRRRVGGLEGVAVHKWEAGLDRLEQFIIENQTFALAVNPSNNDLILDGGNHIEVYGPFGEPHTAATQTFATIGLEESTGIAASATALYATQRSADSVEAFAFAPLKPRVEAESVSEVGSASATFHGQVLPQGEPTSYFFEYGTTTAYGMRTVAEFAGAGTVATGVLASVEGLSPDTTYHFRLAATNANGERRGPDVSFSTFPSGILGLPDGRGYELVSSLGNGDATVTGGVRAAGDGGAVAYQGQAPPVGGNGNSGNPNSRGINYGGGDNEYFASRLAGSGWSASDIQPGSLESVQYHAFSNDLSVGVLSSSEAVVAGAPDSEALYARDDRAGGFRLLGVGASYAGLTPDGQHVLYSTGAAGLFETGAGAPSPVNVLPEGGSAAHAAFGAPAGPDLSNAISSDGSRVFWTQTDAEGKPQRLFVTEAVGTPAARAVQIDASAVHGSAGGGGLFSTASNDGSTVFFTACSVLTPDSTAVPTTACERTVERNNEIRTTPAGNDLYQFDVATGVLHDLSVDHAANANVVGVLGASADGAYVYFAAGGALASGAEEQECVRATPTEISNFRTAKCNVYVVHDGGAPRFLAAVTGAEWADWAPVVGQHSAYVASGSGDLVFSSGEDLTGFDSRRSSEIYMYTPGAGLSCVSCNPSGAPTPPGTGVRLPASGNPTYALRDISAGGDRVFFDTSEGLVSQDENGREDVYEWERDGSGSCTRAAGCLYLLSGGTSTDNSTFVDASENGSDVFIMTRAELVPKDHGEVREIYDVRVGALPELTPPVCTGSGCQGAPGAPPIFSTPSSATFNGIGNFPPPPPSPVKLETRTQKLAKALKACRKDRAKRKRTVCEKTARKKYRAPRAKKAGVQRRAGKDRGARP